MAGVKIVCNTNNVEYATIRKAMCNGARTLDEIKEVTGVCTECEGCKENLDYILSTLCGCKDVLLETVVNAVKNGADTIEKVVEATGAGTGEDCRRCKTLIANVIELGR